MQRFIDFGYDRVHSPKTMDNPIHNGKIPRKYSSVEGVRIDGEVVEFADPEFPDRVHRALRATQAVQKAGQPVDCLWFAILMDDDRNVDKLASGKFRVEDNTEEERVSPTDLTQHYPVNIGRGFHDMRYSFVHSAYPAHTVNEAKYLHKLGDSGPLCLSGLWDAINIFQGSAAHAMSSYELVPEC